MKDERKERASDFEINSLAESFSDMSAKLREKNAELESERRRLEELNTQMLAEIEEHKRTEEALRASEERFVKIFNLSPNRMGIIRQKDGVVLQVNDTWVRDTGFPREETVGRPISELSQWLGDETRVRIRKLLEEGQPIFSLDGPLHTRAGEERIALISAAIVNLDGERCYIWASNDITERKETEENLKVSREQLRALSESLRKAKEEEGIRIARELHDELGAALTSLKWSLTRLDKDCQDEVNTVGTSARAKIQEMVGLVDATINTVRRISTELRPGVLDDLGLVSAIEWHAQQFQANTGIVCHFESLMENADLGREQATTVFRIFQEAMTNILRHARATRVNVLVEEEEDEFVLEVRDNGRGITESEKLGMRSLGLLGMRERAHSIGGRVEINGTAGKGTLLTVRLPLQTKGTT